MIIASSSIGKTLFIQRYARGHFSNAYKATIILEFGFKIFNYKECLYRIQFWSNEYK